MTAAVRAELNRTWDKNNPAIARLQTAIDVWKSSLSFGVRLKWMVGGNVRKPVVLDFPPGVI